MKMLPRRSQLRLKNQRLKLNQLRNLRRSQSPHPRKKSQLKLKVKARNVVDVETAGEETVAETEDGKTEMEAPGSKEEMAVRDAEETDVEDAVATEVAASLSRTSMKMASKLFRTPTRTEVVTVEEEATEEIEEVEKEVIVVAEIEATDAEAVEIVEENVEIAGTAAEVEIDHRLNLQVDPSESKLVVLTEAETEISVYRSTHDQLQFKLLLML
jgi:hypothetical protein